MTLRSKMFRLNVGPVEVCTFVVDAPLHFLMRVYDDLPEMPSGVTLGPQRGPYLYKAVPIDSAAMEIDDEARWPLPSALVDAHIAYVGEAASRRSKSTFAGAFSVGVLLFMEAVLGKRLPRPGYFNEVDSGFSHYSPDELTVDEALYEGAAQLVTVNAFERDARARRVCIEHHGTACAACGLRFGDVYGPMMNGFIHVHHLRPISEAGGQYQVDPVEDLRPVCPNCHAALHARRPPLTIGELREMMSHARAGATPD